MQNYADIQATIYTELNEINFFLKSMVFKEKNYLSDYFWQFISNNSKQLRSVITILIIKMLFGKISEKQLKICAVTEIIHNASLFHDDVMDSAETRRKKPSFNKLFNDKTAVISGDYLLCSALQELSTINNSTITNLYISSMLNICNGEIEQLSLKNKIPTIEEYLSKTEKKTAELFKITIKSALTVEKQLQYIDFAENFGKNFGIAFQIKDDLSNFINKNNDYKDGIYTAPVIFYAQENNIVKTDDSILLQIKNSDAISKTHNLLTEFVNKALDLTKDFSDNQYKQALSCLCNMLKKGI